MALAAASGLARLGNPPDGEADLSADPVLNELHEALGRLPDYAYVRPWIKAGEGADRSRLLVL